MPAASRSAALLEALPLAAVSLRRKRAAQQLLAKPAWATTARPSQLTPPGDWYVWLILAGRGWGKTRTGAEDMTAYALAHPGSRLAIVAPTAASTRDVCVEGESGLLGCLPRAMVQIWNRSMGELVLTNGSRFKLFSADEPDRLRGYQHHRAWCDEIASWRYPDAWDQLLLGLRLGMNPQVVVTTTPRAVALIRGLLTRTGVHVTRGSTFENEANLATAALEQLKARYEGTRLGRQELLAEILDDNPGALWKRSQLDADRVSQAPELARIVIGVDPSGGDGPENDEQGIVAAGKGVDGRGYVLADRTCKLDPDGWGRRVVKCYLDLNADCVVVEKNFGGAMATHVIRTAAQAMGVPIMHIKEVTASRGKAVRADPVSALDAQHRISHVGSLPELEDELCDWEPDSGESPNRLDARVWAVTDLMLGPSRKPEFL